MKTDVPVASRYVVNAKGQWLRADFAAAYLRSMADGCPAGGISGKGAGRTQKDQEYLHDQYLHHGGPLAAWPWWTSNHIDGTALDISTGTKAQRWLSQGGRYDRAVPGEKIRANEYGMIRTVNGSRHNEPWHFAYNRAKDKHRAADLAARLKTLGFANVKAFQKASKLVADGVDGPATWGALLAAPVPAKPTPEVPVPSTDVELRAASYNIQSKRFGGGSYSADTAFVKEVLRPSVLFLQEADEVARTAMCQVMGFKVWPHNYLGLLWDPDKYLHGPKISVSFDSKGVQGADAAKLTVRANGASFVACSVHVRPNDAIPGSVAQKLAGKKADVAKVIKMLAPYPNVIVGGDLSTEHARALFLAAGYRQVTPNVDTYKTNKLDAMFVKGSIVDRTGGSVHKTPASDHDALVANLTIPAPAPVPVPTN